MAALALFQVASILALVGMGLGWRGVMTKYSGFYDLPTAWSMMFWGILLGGFYGKLADEFILLPLISEGGFPFTNFVLCLVLGVIVHLILRRERVRKTGSQPTTGWALGLSVGGMIGMYTIYRVIENEPEVSIFLIITVILIALLSPRGHALIFSRHGYEMLQDKRWRATFKTFVLCSVFLVALYSSMFDIRTWIFVIPVLMIAERKAHDWVWAAVPRPARRRLRRIWADASRNIAEEE